MIRSDDTVQRFFMHGWRSVVPSHRIYKNIAIIGTFLLFCGDSKQNLAHSPSLPPAQYSLAAQNRGIKHRSVIVAGGQIYSSLHAVITKPDITIYH